MNVAGLKPSRFPLLQRFGRAQVFMMFAPPAKRTCSLKLEDDSFPFEMVPFFFSNMLIFRGGENIPSHH